MEIKTRRIKLILLFFGCILMTLLCIYFIKYVIELMSLPPSLGNSIFLNIFIFLNRGIVFLVTIVGIAGILFFMIGVIVAIVKLIQNKPALIIGSKGFVDHSTFSALGFIEWKDVTQIKLEIQIDHTEKRHKFIGVYVNNIDSLLHNKNWFVRKMVIYSMKSGRAPIVIVLKFSKEKPEEVLTIMHKYWDEWKEKNKVEIEGEY